MGIMEKIDALEKYARYLFLPCYWGELCVPFGLSLPLVSVVSVVLEQIMNGKAILRFGFMSVLVVTTLSTSAAQAQLFPGAANFFSRLSNYRVDCANVWNSSAVQSNVYEGTRRSIFNGEDLSGWTNVKGEAPGEGWKVEDGVIYREKNSGDLYLEGKYENFILEFEFKVCEKGNSGVKYRSWNTDGWGMGCEYQIFDDIAHKDNPPRYQTAALYDVVVPREGTQKIRMGEFNKGKIIVLGNHIEHYLNDELIVSVDVGSEEWNRGVEKSKFKDTPEFGTTTVGRILLQDHNDRVWFKNLYITELQPVGRYVPGCFY